MDIKYLGHSAFELSTKEYKILIDPFLIASPNYNFNQTSNIFVTHGHSDHLGSAIEISKKTNAPITAVFELAKYCASQGANIMDMGLGSWRDYEWGRAILVPAYHSSSLPNGNYAGCPCGFVFEIENKVIYHAGDTALNREMKTIGEIYQPDIVMLPIGGNYTMDIEHAVIASEWLGASEVIPMHYNTFDVISVDISEFEKEIKNVGKVPRILPISE